MGVSVLPLLGKAADVTSIVPNSKLGEFRHSTLVQSKKTLLGRTELIVAPSPSVATHTHPGVDIVAKCGSPIYSAADGYVVDVINSNTDRDFKFLGYMALVKHAAGIGGKDSFSLYLHMGAKPRVAIFHDVKSRKTVLGKVGKTGVATGCHTHVEVRHFATRYLYDTGWNRPWNVYGKGDQRNAERFSKNWKDPLAPEVTSPQRTGGNPTFDKGVGFYWASAGKTNFLSWPAQRRISKNLVREWIRAFKAGKFVDIPKDVKFYSYGLDIGVGQPPHLLGFGFFYVDLNNKKHGTWAARFLPVHGYKEKVYEIVLDGPHDKLKSGEMKYKFLAFKIPRRLGRETAFLFRYKDKSKGH